MAAAYSRRLPAPVPAAIQGLSLRTRYFRAAVSAALSAMVATTLVLAGCGGGGGSSGTSVGSVSAPNTVAVVVKSAPFGPTQTGTVNIPYASVTVCEPNTTNCAVIDDMLVDTGSVGVRIFASALASAGISLQPRTDPANSQNSIAECMGFIDGYLWGTVATASLKIGGESADNLAVHVLNDNGSYGAVAPMGCKQLGINNSLTSPNSFWANGVLGIGPFAEDCADECATCASASAGCESGNPRYYSCDTTTGACSAIPLALTAQVGNPIVLFATDNNGSILSLPTIPDSGQVSATGTLTFGIGTQSNNALGNAFVLALDGRGLFTTTFNGTTLDNSFIDSGSNAYYFNDSLTACSGSASNPNQPYFYCPSPMVMLSAVNQGHDAIGATTGPTSTVSFKVADLDTLSGANFAFDDMGGTAVTVSGTNSLSGDFDFGLPFFYGRRVFTGIDGYAAAGIANVTGPYFAY
jgi:hypothetical protein